MEDGDGHEEDVEEQPYHILSMEASTKTDPGEKVSWWINCCNMW